MAEAETKKEFVLHRITFHALWISMFFILYVTIKGALYLKEIGLNDESWLTIPLSIVIILGIPYIVHLLLKQKVTASFSENEIHFVFCSHWIFSSKKLTIPSNEIKYVDERVGSGIYAYETIKIWLENGETKKLTFYNPLFYKSDSVLFLKAYRDFIRQENERRSNFNEILPIKNRKAAFYNSRKGIITMWMTVAIGIFSIFGICFIKEYFKLFLVGLICSLFYLGSIFYYQSMK